MTTTLLSWGYNSSQCPWTFLLFIYVNIMPLQIQHGSLLQYADDTCLICCGSTHLDLQSLSGWIANSKVFINIKRSSVMWFSVRPLQSVTYISIFYVDGHSLECVDTKKYLGLYIDSKFSWRSHVTNICKKMAYYLYLIGYHQSTLPKSIIKMLVEPLSNVPFWIMHFLHGVPH